MAFSKNYPNLVAEKPQAHTRLIRNYDGSNKDFDFIIVGSGMGGGILADDLAERLGSNRRILVLDTGSFVYPTHVYNLCRAPNFTVARHFGVDSFKPLDSAEHFIGEKPQMALGGRSIFWSGLIPQAQPWELEFFPDAVRNSLSNLLPDAAERMNLSRSLGDKAAELVRHFQNTSLNDDFIIEQTPRALHQPYLRPDGTPGNRFFTEPTGVFNTAELLINQVGLTPGADQGGPGLFIRLNSFVEGIHDVPFDWHEVRVTDTITGQQESFYTPKVIIAAGSIESPKLINRSAAYKNLPDAARQLVGYGLTDHPVTGESRAYVSTLGTIPISTEDHAKIIFYSRGKIANNRVTYPFNIEMNVNHEYWHLRENDPTEAQVPHDGNRTRVDIKFSFANCLDDHNGILSHANDGYTPDIRFKRFSNLDDLLQARFPAVSGWSGNRQDFFNFLNATRDRIFDEFQGVQWLTGKYGDGNGEMPPFGWGTVHHACGTLRMPWKPDRNTTTFNPTSVVDEDLEVRGSRGVYVCDMSVMPISTAANPVRTLAALALRLSKHLG